MKTLKTVIYEPRADITVLELARPCSYCGNLIPDSGIWGVPTYTDRPGNHKEGCPIKEMMEVNEVKEKGEGDGSD